MLLDKGPLNSTSEKGALNITSEEGPLNINLKGPVNVTSCRIYFHGSWGLLDAKEDSRNITYLNKTEVEHFIHPAVNATIVPLCTLDRMTNCSNTDLSAIFTEIPRADHRIPKHMIGPDKIADHRFRDMNDPGDWLFEEWIQRECDTKVISFPVLVVVLVGTLVIASGLTSSLTYCFRRLVQKLERRHQKRLEKGKGKSEEVEMQELDQMPKKIGP